MIARRAVLTAAAALPDWPAWALDGMPIVELTTELGGIRLKLSPKAPLTSANFLAYVDSGRLSEATFYRAARSKGTQDLGLIEGGLQNDPAKLLPPVAHESTTTTGLAHLDGTVSMARYAPGTATADFFICCGPAPSLDADPSRAGDNLGYAAFGRVVDGMEVVRAILALPTGGVARNPVMQGQILDPPVPILGARRA